MLRAICFSLFAIVASTFAWGAETPSGWFLAGSNPQAYVVEKDQSAPHSGKSSARLASKDADPGGFGTLMQMVKADSFRGERIKFTASVRSRSVEDWAGLWMRIDGSNSASLGFDNMRDRPITGDSQWEPHSIVLDVPQSATAIAFGLLLDGSGSVWIDSGSIQVVDKSVPTTGSDPEPELPETPTNLDFEQ